MLILWLFMAGNWLYSIDVIELVCINEHVAAKFLIL